MRFSLILLLACAGDDDKDTNTTTDTGTTTTSDTTDTTTTTNTETDDPQTWNVSFSLSGDYEGATLVLVETYFMDGGDDYYPGVIKKVRKDGTYDIDYEDGDKEKSVDASLIKHMEEEGEDASEILCIYWPGHQK